MAGTDPDPRMRVLLVTVDSSAAVAGTTEILGLPPRIGPEVVESRVDNHLDAVVVMDAVALCYRPSVAPLLENFAGWPLGRLSTVR